MPGTAHRRTIRGSADVNTGRKAVADIIVPPVEDGFRAGIDRPTDLTNGPRIRESQMRVHQGDLTLTAGMYLSGIRITGRLIVTSALCSITDFIVEGGTPPGGSSPTVINTWELINCRNDGIRDGLALLQFGWLRPSYRSHDVYGVRGGNYLARRLIVEGVVDGFTPNGSSSTRKAARIESCLVRDLPTFSPDPRQSDGITHNDAIQAAGNMTALEIVGNDLVGGRTSAVLIQQNVGTYDRVLIDRNWVTGNPTQGSSLNASENSRGPIANYTVTGNRVARTGKSPRFLVPSATLAAATTRIAGNVFMDDGSPLPTSNGG